jgi:transcription initiation factor TFIID TATA-box-binding protein
MSQEGVRQLLQEMSGEASTSEIATRARKRYPNRTLHTYVGQILRQLENKGFVTKQSDLWSLTERGRETSIGGTPITEIDLVVTEDDLRDNGLDVVNIVATIDLNRELDLFHLSTNLSKTEYHPESSPFMTYRPLESASVTLLVPANGMISIVGAKGKEELLEGTKRFLDTFDDLGVEINKLPNDAIVQNIVLRSSLGVELELSAVAVGLGLEQCEYAPEQFSGLIYRLENGSTSLLFRTGKYLINGSKSYVQALKSANQVKTALSELGIKLA